jgi:hypothetical protein
MYGIARLCGRRLARASRQGHRPEQYIAELGRRPIALLPTRAMLAGVCVGVRCLQT